MNNSGLTPTGIPLPSPHTVMIKPEPSHLMTPPKESTPEMCIRLMNSQVIDPNSSIGHCRKEFDIDMEGALNIVFSPYTNSYSKDVLKIKVFTPNTATYTIVEHLQAIMSFAKNKLGGVGGNNGWSNLLLFLHGGDTMSEPVKERCKTLRQLKMPGTQTFNGNVTEQDAAVQVYKYCLLLYYTFKIAGKSDTSMFHVRLLPPTG
jgi:hypothetical protein